MTRIFLLQHVITRSDDDQDVKIIGIYEAEELARAAVQRLKDKPGFQDARGEFSIGPYILNFDYWSDGFVP